MADSKMATSYTLAVPGFSTRSKVVARDIFAGTMAGMIVTIVGHPFDTLKVRLQTQPNPPLYHGLVDCFKKTMKWEGIRGLYKGVSSPIAGQIFCRANMFLSFAEAKRFLARHYDRPNIVSDYFLAGSFSLFTSTFFECPMDVFKGQVQVQTTKMKTIPNYKAPYLTVPECAKQIIKQRGLMGAYQGFLPHVLRNTPAGAVHLGSFEYLRHRFAQKNNIPVAQLSTTHNLVAGGVGGILFWALFFPMDVVKSAMQTDSILPHQRKYKSMVHAIRSLYKEGGVTRFYRGYTPCLLRAVPVNALMLFTVAYITDKIVIKS